MTVDRREFLKLATAGAGLTLAGAKSTSATESSKSKLNAPAVSKGQGSEIVVVGAGAFGMWTALNLVRQGADVTVVDPYGPANSRQTSGGETRGVRTSYGDRMHGDQWAVWGAEAIRRWNAWDEEHGADMLPKLFFNTGDLILRPEMEPYLEDTMANWNAIGTPYEQLDMDEVRRRWPWIKLDEMNVALYEPGAGVVRARRTIESVAKVFEREGGKFVLGRAALGDQTGGRLNNVSVEPCENVSGQTFVLAVGPWFPKFLPELMGKRLRIPIGHVFYFGIPSGNNNFMFPNMPSYGVPGCTGWPALTGDHRGFRVRTGGRPPQDPDESDRWIDKEHHERPREILERFFPDLVGQPVLETRACHYESSIDSNFIVDKHPDFDNVWIAGGGSAEAFKFGPMLGEYIAKRVLDMDDQPELAEGFELNEEEFEEGENWGRSRRRR